MKPSRIPSSRSALRSCWTVLAVALFAALVYGGKARPVSVTLSVPVMSLPDAETLIPPLPRRPLFAFPRGTRPGPAPVSVKRHQKYDYYAALARRKGLEPRGLTVIGLRGVSPDGRRHSSSENATDYDDTFVLLDPDSREIVEFLGSTHAGQATSTLSPGGVAQIKPGLYRGVPCGEYADMPCWLVTTRTGAEALPCWRDADGDGLIGEGESRGSAVATEILFHNGRYDDHGSSIGCQVLPPSLMRRFIARIGKENSFDYLLVDANRRFS